MSWAKMAANLDRNPKIRAAGPDAREVFLYFLRVNRDIDADGELPPGYASIPFLANELMRDETDMKRGLFHGAQCKLFEYDLSGVRILGWDETWAETGSSTERVRKHREKKKAHETGETFHVTEGNGETHRGEEIRGEEKRSIPKRAKGAGKGAANGDLSGPVTERVVAAFNRGFERNLTPDGWREPVRRALAKGFTEQELIGVVWWAAEEWADDPEMRLKVSPQTLFKLQSGQGYRTLPQYISCATELWLQTHEPNEPPPWRANQPTLEVVR